MRKASRTSVLAVAFAVAAMCPACLNDRDTLADEANKNRQVLATLVGAFERNPPLYYQMRIDRIKKDLAKDPKLIDEYDDIAVAYDRIGNDDEAIKWIEAKKKELEPLNMSDEKSKDEWYRYYANCGTFCVHRWARNGSDPKDIVQVEHGRDLIDHALKINPNAHFGREKYQRVVMSWLIDTRSNTAEDWRKNESLAEYIESWVSSQGKDIESQREEAIVGLAGLIRLGGAWESPDVYWAIGSLYFYPHQAMGHLCDLRAEEIIRSNKDSIDMSPSDMHPYYASGPDFDSHELSEYKRLRKLADQWHDEREEFMMAKLKKGDHPDTDPHFWDGVPTLPPLEVQQSLGSWMQHDVMTIGHQMWLGLACCLGTPIVLFLSIRGYRRQFPKTTV